MVKLYNLHSAHVRDNYPTLYKIFTNNDESPQKGSEEPTGYEYFRQQALKLKERNQRSNSKS